MSFKFEKLIVWEKALELSYSVSLIVKKFPKEELFGLRSQMQRAADSVGLNIAEGSTGVTQKEFERFIGISIRSAVEMVACLYLGKRRSIINDKDFETCYNQINELVKMLQAFRKSLSVQKQAISRQTTVRKNYCRLTSDVCRLYLPPCSTISAKPTLSSASLFLN